MSNLQPRTELAVPIVPTNGIETVTLDFTRVYIAESRADEISHVTPHKSGELLSLFNDAYLVLSNMQSQLRLHQARAEDAINKVKARLLLEEVIPKLKAMGVPSSADTRQAVIDLDPDYQAAKERYDFITSTLEFVKGKQKYMENNYTAVKKILGENAWNMTVRPMGDHIPKGAQVGDNINSIFGEARDDD